MNTTIALDRIKLDKYKGLYYQLYGTFPKISIEFDHILDTEIKKLEEKIKNR